MKRINSSSPKDPESQNYQEDPVRETVAKSYTSQHSSSVIFGFYALFFLFAISFCGSIAIVLLMAGTKNNVSFKIHQDSSGNPEIEESPGLGQFGSTATGIILIGVPLLILILLIFYSYLHDMRRYFSPGI